MRLLILTLISVCVATRTSAADGPLRAGMIGLDTSHVPAFAKLFNDPKAAGDFAGIKIVAGYPGGTDLPSSKDRVERFTQQIRDLGIEIVDTIPALLAKVDVVLLESVDGRIHLQEAIPVIQAGKPLWIDKPVAGSLTDAILIYELAKKHNVPVFSSSSARFSAGFQALSMNEQLGSIEGAQTWGPCSVQPGIPDLFFYGIHGIEPLFLLMGRGCETVARVQTPDTDLVTGVWQGGRIGTYRGIRKNKSDAGAIAFGSKAIVPAGRDRESGGSAYEPLCREIAKFFKTRQAPVTADETLEIFAFMEAADESKRRGGAPVKLAEVLEKAKAEAERKLKSL
jgi:hypothetical protein